MEYFQVQIGQSKASKALGQALVSRSIPSIWYSLANFCTKSTHLVPLQNTKIASWNCGPYFTSNLFCRIPQSYIPHLWTIVLCPIILQWTALFSRNHKIPTVKILNSKETVKALILSKLFAFPCFNCKIMLKLLLHLEVYHLGMFLKYWSSWDLEFTNAEILNEETSMVSVVKRIEFKYLKEKIYWQWKQAYNKNRIFGQKFINLIKFPSIFFAFKLKVLE